MLDSALEGIVGAAGAAGEKIYVEDVFSTYLYNGEGTTTAITNSIDLSGEGGMVWLKPRHTGNHMLFDTERGVNRGIISNSTSGDSTKSSTLTAFNSDGFTLGYNASYDLNESGYIYTSWTFRKAKKFFDVVKYTGTGVDQNISHNLGSVPGFIIIKCLSNSYGWQCYHRSLGASDRLSLNTTDQYNDGGIGLWNSTTPTSTTFSVDGGSASVNGSGETYVAYLFAHDAGGFGDDGDQSIIKCGSYTTDGSGLATIDLGWEPQFILRKAAIGTTDNWLLVDNMRGLNGSNADEARLYPNTTDTEDRTGDIYTLTPTGFVNKASPSYITYVYVAIRRGPMKTPELATQVFYPIAWAGSPGGARNGGFPVDMQIAARRDGSNHMVVDRMREVQTYSNTSATGTGKALFTTLTQAEVDSANFTNDWNNTGYREPAYGNTSSNNYIAYSFRRAPGFFDIVTYTGNGSTQNISHNLGVVPELIIIKRREGTVYWPVYVAPLGNETILELNTTNTQQGGASQWNSTTPTSTQFSLGNTSGANANGGEYVAYLFASLAGISKIGSYTGNGSTQTINCGFSSGARFVLAKKTTNPGSWRVFDTVRGINAGGDPSIRLESSAAEETDDDIDATSSGFIVNETNTANINTNGETYIFFAIA